MTSLTDRPIMDTFFLGFIGLGASAQNLQLNVPNTGTAAITTPDNYVLVVDYINVTQHVAAGVIALQMTNGVITIPLWKWGITTAETSKDAVDGFDIHIQVPRGYYLQGLTSGGSCDMIIAAHYEKGGSFS